MSTPLTATPLTALQAELAGVRTEPYLLTVTAGQSVHCGVVRVRIDESDGDGVRLHVGPVPSSWPGSDAAGLHRVTLLWPPDEPGNYSLIVDGTAAAGAGTDLLVSVSRAVWHRPGVGPDGSACGSDCKPILGKGATLALGAGSAGSGRTGGVGDAPDPYPPDLRALLEVLPAELARVLGL